MSNLVSSLLGADILVFKPLLDQEQVRPATKANVMKSTSHPEDFIDYAIAERDSTIFPANMKNVHFQRINSETLSEVGGGKDKFEISEGMEQGSKLLIDIVWFKLASPMGLEGYDVDSTSPKWPEKPVIPKDAPQVPNDDEIVCVMPVYFDPQYKSVNINHDQDNFISSDQHESELLFDAWIDFIF